MIKSVIDQIFPFAIMLVVFAIIFVGFKYVYAVVGANEDGVKAAKRLFVPLFIGAAIIAGSKAIVEAVKLFANGFQ